MICAMGKPVCGNPVSMRKVAVDVGDGEEELVATAGVVADGEDATGDGTITVGDGEVGVLIEGDGEPGALTDGDGVGETDAATDAEGVGDAAAAVMLLVIAERQVTVAPPPFPEPLHWLTVTGRAVVSVDGSTLHCTRRVPPPPLPELLHWSMTAPVVLPSGVQEVVG